MTTSAPEPHTGYVRLASIVGRLEMCLDDLERHGLLVDQADPVTGVGVFAQYRALRGELVEHFEPGAMDRPEASSPSASCAGSSADDGPRRHDGVRLGPPLT